MTDSGALPKKPLPDALALAGQLYEKSHLAESRPGVVAHYREAKPFNSRHVYVRRAGALYRWKADHVDLVNPDQGVPILAPVLHFAIDHPLGRAASFVALSYGAARLVSKIRGV